MESHQFLFHFIQNPRIKVQFLFVILFTKLLPYYNSAPAYPIPDLVSSISF